MSMHGPCARMTLHGFALVDVSHGSWTVHAKRIEYCRPCFRFRNMSKTPSTGDAWPKTGLYTECIHILQALRLFCAQPWCAGRYQRAWELSFLLTRNQIRLLRMKENEPTVSSKLCVVEQQYIQEADTLIQLPMRWSEVKTQRVLLRTQMMMLKHPQMSGDDTTAARRAKYQIQTCGHTCIALSSDVRKPATEKEAKDAGSKPLNSTDVEASTFSFCTWTGLRATWILSSSFLFAERQAWG